MCVVDIPVPWYGQDMRIDDGEQAAQVCDAKPRPPLDEAARQHVEIRPRSFTVACAAHTATMLIQPGEAVEGRTQERRGLRTRDEGDGLVVDVDEDLLLIRPALPR